MYDAYHRIFTRCGLNFRAVEADAGSIGGEGGTHEFMALADIGEDTIASCTCCNYAANLEKAEYGIAHMDAAVVEPEAPKRLHTPGIKKIEQLTESLGHDASVFIKTLIFVADGNPVAILVRGDHEVNEIKVKQALAVDSLALADQETTERVTGAPTGFAGPVGLAIPVFADFAVTQMAAAIVGANEADYHLANIQPGVHFNSKASGDYRNAAEGDRCPRCEEGRLQFHRGIEIGHVFKLGTKYSEAMEATFLD
ncbi:YbaK/EbsC family protein, partial [Paenibacillus sp. MCAF20]